MTKNIKVYSEQYILTALLLAQTFYVVELLWILWKSVFQVNEILQIESSKNVRY